MRKLSKAAATADESETEIEEAEVSNGLLTQLQNALALPNLELMHRAHLTLQVGLLQLILQTLPLLMRSTPRHWSLHEGLWRSALTRLWDLTTQR